MEGRGASSARWWSRRPLWEYRRCAGRRWPICSTRRSSCVSSARLCCCCSRPASACACAGCATRPPRPSMPTAGWSASLSASRAGDEIGDLARDFSAMMERLREYNHYLEQLARRLSHELRTPITVVRSSLEAMELDQADGDQGGLPFPGPRRAAPPGHHHLAHERSDAPGAGPAGFGAGTFFDLQGGRRRVSWSPTARHGRGRSFRYRGTRASHAPSTAYPTWWCRCSTSW